MYLSATINETLNNNKEKFVWVNPEVKEKINEAETIQKIPTGYKMFIFFISFYPPVSFFINEIYRKTEIQFPQNFKDLEELPAVGHKTASVVMSQAFGIPAFPVDTHIQRLMYRWNLSNGKNVVQTEKDAKRLFPKELWNKLHLQIIFYGREYSPARSWDIEKDIITKTIGRKSVLKDLKS